MLSAYTFIDWESMAPVEPLVPFVEAHKIWASYCVWKFDGLFDFGVDLEARRRAPKVGIYDANNPSDPGLTWSDKYPIRTFGFEDVKVKAKIMSARGGVGHRAFTRCKGDMPRLHALITAGLDGKLPFQEASDWESLERNPNPLAPLEPLEPFNSDQQETRDSAPIKFPSSYNPLLPAWEQSAAYNETLAADAAAKAQQEGSEDPTELELSGPHAESAAAPSESSETAELNARLAAAELVILKAKVAAAEAEASAITTQPQAEPATAALVYPA
eukprot:gene19198-2539_t